MSRVPTTNYLADTDTQFEWATDDNDPFDRELDLSYVARALERHTHGAGRGLQIPTDGIANDAVTAAKIAPGAVGNTELGADAVTADKIAAGAVGASEIVDGGVGTDELSLGAVTSAKLAAGAALANLGFTPINKVSDTGVGDITFGPGKTLSFGGVSNPGRMSDVNTGYTQILSHNNFLRVYNALGTVLMLEVTPTTVTVLGQLLAASAAISGHVTADTAAIAGLLSAQNMGVSGLVQGQQLQSVQPTGIAPLIVASTTEVANLNASRVAGKIPTVTPAAGALPLADGSGKLDAWITPATLGAFVQSGSIMLFGTAAAIPAGYTRESNLDGRIPVGAGTTFSKTFVEATNYGAAWQITPTGTVVVTIANANSDNTAQTATGGGTHATIGTHSHGITSQTFTGNAFNIFDGMALRAYVYAKKD